MTNFTNAYTMFKGAGALQLVQSGFIKKTPASFTEHFSQAVYIYFGQVRAQTFFANAQLFEGQSYEYQQATYTTGTCPMTSRCVLSYAGNVLLQASNFDPLNSWNGPFKVEYSGETGYKESDIPGRTVNKTAFTGMRYLYNENFDSIQQPCGVGVVNDNKARWAMDRPACDQMRVWTAVG